MNVILVKNRVMIAIVLSGILLVNNTFAIDIGNIELKLSGYIKTDLIYDTKQDLGDLSFSGKLSTSSDDEGHFRMHARESRLRLDIKKGSSKGVLEFDLYGSGGNEVVSNSHTLRLRHAYFQSGKWLVGQTWSTFMDFMTFPKLLDFGSGPGVSFIRQAQLRYTNGGFSASLENTELKVPSGLTAIEKAPDLVLKYRRPGKKVGFYVAGLVRRLEAKDAVGTKDSIVAGAIHAGIAFHLSKNITLGFNAIAGAPGRYNQEKWFSPDVYIKDGKLEAVESKSFQVTYKHKLSNGSFNIDYGRLDIDDEDGLAVGTFNKITEIHLNRIWTVKDFSYGIEIARQTREDFDGTKANNIRVQGSVIYKF